MTWIQMIQENKYMTLPHDKFNCDPIFDAEDFTYAADGLCCNLTSLYSS